MWWHAKKPGSDDQVDMTTVLLETREKHQSGEPPEPKSACNSIHKQIAVPDSACDQNRGQRPVQALLTLAEGNPSLYKVRALMQYQLPGHLGNQIVYACILSLQALANLQIGPSGTVALSTVESVQQLVSGSQVHQLPRIASMRYHKSATEVQNGIVPSESCSLSAENHMIAANNLCPRYSHKRNESSLEQDCISSSASLREWASGTCSPPTRSSSPADRFARLEVCLPVVPFSSERSPSRSISPSKAHSTGDRWATRNSDDEPYHPLARDYPASSSAGVSLQALVLCMACLGPSGSYWSSPTSACMIADGAQVHLQSC